MAKNLQHKEDRCIQISCVRKAFVLSTIFVVFTAAFRLWFYIPVLGGIPDHPAAAEERIKQSMFMLYGLQAIDGYDTEEVTFYSPIYL